MILLAAVVGPATAQTTTTQIQALQAQIDQLQKTVKALEERQTKANADAAKAKQQAGQAETQAAQAKAQAAQAQVAQASAASLPLKANDGWYFSHKPGSNLTFETPGGETTFYGNLDVSFDDAAKNVGPLKLNGATPPVGNFGWMPDISTNSSYFGIRGFQRLPQQNFNFVYQLEAGFEISATPGNKETNSVSSNQVNGALFSRNSFIGLANGEYGALKIGKTTAPYANSTAIFNPFAGTWGDYEAVMGNTGGDLRDEFNTRLDHAVWYESPTINGWQWNFLFAPGQNRSYLSTNLAAGESDCTGLDTPQSGGNAPDACNDGSFSNALSTNLSYTNGGFYTTAAFEWHQNVNRQSDITAIYGLTNPASSGCSTLTGASAAACQNYFNQDVADEWATKVGALYAFSTGTTVGGILEYLHRDVPADLEFQNERTRFGTWLFVSQEINPVDSIHFGWAHAFHTPGDPGQHNDATLTTADGAGTYAPNNNQADLISALWKHKLGPNLTWYSDVATIFNGPSAHYALGAGGVRGVATDCHDASDADGNYGPDIGAPGPACFTGTTIVGVSTGIQWRF
jgi:predicted porin/outer membrane murein-binding lipoprotein Lpp